MSDFQVHASAVVDPGARIGAGTKIWHFSHIMSGASVGQDCLLGQNVFIDNGVEIGNRVKIQNNVSVYSGVTCEDEVFIGPSVVFTNVINPRAMISRKHEFKNTLIRKGATLGANATIICGIEIGCFSMIGAGAVVTSNVPDYALVVGNPASFIGWISEYGCRLNFNTSGKAICPESQVEYRLENNRCCRL